MGKTKPATKTAAPVAATPAAASPAPAPATPPTVPPATSQMPWEQFASRVWDVTDRGKLSKALAMLRKDKFRLYAEVHPDHVCGVVRAQSTDRRVYACRIAQDGQYSCCTQNLITCVVSKGAPCKHLLVLVVGLVKAGQLDGTRALEWLQKSRRMGLTAAGCKPDKDVVTATFLKYKGMEAGEVDWRPTDTIPEDFYAA